MLKRVMALQVVWFLCFLAGGVLVIVTAWSNNHLPASCNGQGGALGKAGVVAAVTAGCERHSYLPAVLLILLGVGGLLATGYVATRLAVGYLGEGAMAFLRNGHFFAGPTGSRSDAGPSGFPGGARVVGPGPASGLPPAGLEQPPPGATGPERS
jgi:vacuolar-type H+-ATPase subunit I/STV1